MANLDSNSAQCVLSWSCACFNGNLKYAGGREHGPSLTLRARELSMHGAAASLFSAGEKSPGIHTGDTALHGSSTCTCFNTLAGRRSSSQHGSDPIFSPLRSTIGRRRRPLRLFQPQSRLMSPGLSWP